MNSGIARRGTAMSTMSSAPFDLASQNAFSRASISCAAALRREHVHVRRARARRGARRPHGRRHRAGRRGRSPCGRRGRRARSSWTSSGMPSSRPYSRWIAAIVSMSMYSRIDGARPLVMHLGNGGRDFVERRERRQDGGAEGRTRHQLERRFGHECERALRADDELGEVVAGRGLDDPTAGADDVAGGQRQLQSEHVLAGDPVLDRLHAAGVRGDVAADGRAVLTRVHGVGQPDPGERGVELVELDARLHDGEMRVLVDLEDAVHPLERHDDAAVRWDASTREPRAAAARGDRYPVLGARPEHVGHLRRWTRAGRRRAVVTGCAPSASSWDSSSMTSTLLRTLRSPTLATRRSMNVFDSSTSMAASIPRCRRTD